MKSIIEVNHVWKEYQKGIDRRYKSLRDTLVGMPNRLFGAEKEKFWALEDIDFKVEAGESVGIIGRNGAGKSTLLKLLSRITPPTKGEIILRGRVASLLEVGTGFHPELTGRENVFFNGSILGMKNQEIKRKFDEIVDFSGVESFIDTPLKHFSSGMQMRLAFSVVSHMVSDIILIDEIFGVGDAGFQTQCFDKIRQLTENGNITIILVSHDLPSVQNLCFKTFWLEKGVIVNFGKTIDIINDFIKYSSIKSAVKLECIYGEFNVEILQNNKNLSNIIETASSFTIKVTLNFNKTITNFNIGIGINSAFGSRIVTYHTKYQLNSIITLKKNAVITCKVENFPLISGSYYIELSLFEFGTHTFYNNRNVCQIEVVTLDFYKTGMIPDPSYQGFLLQNSEWQFK